MVIERRKVGWMDIGFAHISIWQWKKKIKKIKDNQLVDYWREVSGVNVQYKPYASCTCSQEKERKEKKNIYIYICST